MLFLACDCLTLCLVGIFSVEAVIASACSTSLRRKLHTCHIRSEVDRFGIQTVLFDWLLLLQESRLFDFLREAHLTRSLYRLITRRARDDAARQETAGV